MLLSQATYKWQSIDAQIYLIFTFIIHFPIEICQCNSLPAVSALYLYPEDMKNKMAITIKYVYRKVFEFNSNMLKQMLVQQLKK